MKKIVLRVDIHDGKGKQKAMKVVATLQGIDSIAVDLNERKMTVIGIVDPIHVVEKLRKCWPTAILSVGPKDEPKKDGKEEPKKEEPKKEDEEKKKKDTQKMVEELVEAYKAYNPFMTTHYFVQSAEENPNACAIL